MLNGWKGIKMKAKTALNGLFGMLAITGLILICSCDTETPMQLFWIVCLGFALLCFGGRGLIINNRSKKND